jgi:uncharacterized protein with FMN-binding domain
VRRPTAVATALASLAVLATTWQLGARHEPGQLGGVYVVSPPQRSSAAPRPAGTGPTGKGPTGKGPTTPATRGTTSSRQQVDGAVVGTPYGTVQVRVVLKAGRIVDVQALRLTDANGHSRDLSAMAEPTLRREALTAQSATIDSVSGATYTSEGYRQSLQAAIDAAHA